MERQGHLERVTQVQQLFLASEGGHELDRALLKGRLREAIRQAGASGASIEEIRDARAKAYD